MNVERLVAIAEWLEAGAPERDGVSGFCMESFQQERSCGTVCCIAGAANSFWSPLKNQIDTRDLKSDSYPLATRAAELLGVEFGPLPLQGLAWDLFMIEGDDFLMRRITPAWAARCIRKLIATGEVDWTGTREAQS
jgi:hypothetical protein